MICLLTMDSSSRRPSLATLGGAPAFRRRRLAIVDDILRIWADGHTHRAATAAGASDFSREMSGRECKDGASRCMTLASGSKRLHAIRASR